MSYEQILKIEEAESNIITRAIVFASERHSAQKRKGLPWPYIVHIYEVAQILRENGASQDAVVAGILHDTVEDTGTSLEEIALNFGYKIASIVDVLSEDKSLPYAERKKVQAERIKVASREAKMVKCADCLSNIKSLFYDENIDKNLWNRFNSTKDNIKAHYKSTIEATPDLEDLKMFQELKSYYEKVFEPKNMDASHRFSLLLNLTSSQRAKTEVVSLDTNQISNQNEPNEPSSSQKRILKHDTNTVFACVDGKQISDCTDCKFMAKRLAPDPDDWFDDDDEEYICNKLGMVLSRYNRPYEKQPIPNNCPYRDR